MFSCTTNNKQRNKYDGDSTIVHYDFNLLPKSKTEISLSFTRNRDSIYVYKRISKINKKDKYILKFAFKLDTIVLDQYNNHGVKILLSKYCRKIHYGDGIENIVLDKVQNTNQKWTIIYMMTKNNYKYIRDDLTGYDIFESIPVDNGIQERDRDDCQRTQCL